MEAGPFQLHDEGGTENDSWSSVHFLPLHPHAMSHVCLCSCHSNKTGTSQVGAISKAQKAQRFKNCKRGDPFALFETSVCCKISKNLKRGLWIQKNSKKVKKVQKIPNFEKKVQGGFYSPVRFRI